MDEDLKDNPIDGAEDNTGDETDTENPPVDPDNPDEPIQPETPPDEPEEPDRDNWTYKDISDFYERVRLALNAVSDVTLPDKYMDYPEKAPFSEAYIKGRVPHWKELPEEKFAIFESVIVYQTATLFQSIVSSKRVKKQAIPTITLEYSDKEDFLLDGMSLKDMIEYLIGTLNDEEQDKATFIGFRVTDGTNGYCERFVNAGGCCIH